MTTRGLRNNNPGNIRRSRTAYMGEVATADAAFKAFSGPQWGYRAMFALLFTYQQRYGAQTIRQMIARYAPPSENDTEAYVRAVSEASGIGPDVRITATSRDVMLPVVAAMSRVENGKEAVAADVREGWELFMRHRP